MSVPDRPNIVLVLTDDMGACDLGFYGNADARTPRLDALAANSVRHEAFYVTPVCAPTRAALLTGRHHLRTSVAGVHGGKDHVHLSETLLPQLLKRAGYATGIWGKWHSGTSDGYLPHQRGFDETLLLRLYRHRDPVGQANGGEPIPFEGRWGDDVIVEHALDFARRHADQPFFAMVASMTPHGRLDAPAEEIERLMREDGLTRNLATLHAQMAHLDAAIGRLVDGLNALDTGGRETILLFLSDNGPAMLENDFTDLERDRRNNLHWRGWKGDVWEGGIRTPLFIHRIGSSDTGVIKQPADATDLLPTFVAWAGAEYAADQLPLDGRDLTPMLAGEVLPEKPVYTWVHPAIPPYPNRGDSRIAQDEYGPVSPEIKSQLAATEQVLALRQGDWKITRNADLNKPWGAEPPVFLGNVVADPLERRNLATAAAQQDRLQGLTGDLDAWWQGILDEPHSFSPPTLLLRAEANAWYRATATAAISNDLRNEVIAIRGFQRAGQFARWSLHAEAARTVQPKIGWWRDGTMPEGSQIVLRCSGSESIATAAPDGSLTWSAPLDIDAGPNTLELELLRLPAPLAEPLDLFYVALEAPR
ncbi:MAG: sulfatase-like hydrolase/transferase [Opitutales bacterium]